MFWHIDPKLISFKYFIIKKKKKKKNSSMYARSNEAPFEKQRLKLRKKFFKAHRCEIPFTSFYVLKFITDL